MTVLKGEGTHVILYGTYTLPSVRMVPAYFARPDRSGSFPLVVLAHDAGGITSHVKSLCRRLARHGLAVVCPDLYRGGERAGGLSAVSDRRGSADLAEVVDFAARPGTAWASATDIGLLGLGEGGRFAILASSRPEIGAVAVVGTPLGGAGVDPADVAVPLLGIYGSEDEAAAEARSFGGTVARGEFVFYRGAGAGFTDASSDAYDPAAAADALERVISFFSRSRRG